MDNHKLLKSLLKIGKIALQDPKTIATCTNRGGFFTQQKKSEQKRFIKI
jgi:hypothetical protein